ncbi:Ger(x)C family spore germination protein [Bacillus sp. A301a_S52]|nr:Ger(x)C family spore germination protein [Bacillus sp. A301a_S52]
MRGIRGLIIFLSLLFISGCWSSVEIEERGFGVGVAFDIVEGASIENKESRDHLKKDLMTVTYQLINPSPTSQENSEVGSGKKPYNNISQTGDSIHQIVRQFALENEHPVFMSHLKVLVISEEVLRILSLDEILDFHFRDNEVRLSTLAFVSSGKAYETLETNQSDMLPAFRLLDIAGNEYRTTKLLTPVPLAKLIGKMHSGASFLLQNVVSSNGEVMFSGAAVIDGKTNKCLGFINEEELKGYIWLTGEGQGGVVRTLDEETDQIIIFEVDAMESTITPTIDGAQMAFDVSIKSEGMLSESWIDSEEAIDKEFIKRIEKEIEKTVEQLVTGVLEKMQQEYEVDVMGFGEHLRINHPKVWEEMKDDWDQTFRDVPITSNVTITITEYGSRIIK